ncbi:response regulator [Azotobacter vinelandii]
MDFGSEHPVLPALRILIADDVLQNLELLALTLESGGHRIEMAHDGDEAIEKFIANRFDVVLMDVHMPGTDGLQATQLIRQHERTHGLSRTPIIALTASVMADDRHAARQAGMDGFAVKPLDALRLFEEIARVLNIQSPSGLPDEASITANDSRRLIDWARGGSHCGAAKHA